MARGMGMTLEKNPKPGSALGFVLADLSSVAACEPYGRRWGSANNNNGSRFDSLFTEIPSTWFSVWKPHPLKLPNAEGDVKFARFSSSGGLWSV